MSQAPAPATFRFRAPPEAPEHLASRLSGIEARSEFEYVAVSVELEGLTDQIAFTNFMQTSPAPSEDTLQKVAITRLATSNPCTAAAPVSPADHSTIFAQTTRARDGTSGGAGVSVHCALSLYEYVLPVV